MGMWRRKAAAGDDNSQTRERRQWFFFGATKKAKWSEGDNEAPASAKVPAASTGHQRWRLVGLRPMSGVMVLPYRSWHTTGWRRQLPEDQIVPADSSNKRTQAPFLRSNAEAYLPVPLVLMFALCAWTWYKGKLPARQTRAADKTAVAASLRDEEEGARDAPPPVPIRGPERRAVAGAAGAVVSRLAILNQALEEIEEGSTAEAPAIVVNTNGDGRQGRRVPSPAVGRGVPQGEARVRPPPARVRVPVGAAAIVAATPRHAGLNRVLEDGTEEVEREAVVRMPNIAAVDVVPHPVPLGGVHQGGKACLHADVIGGDRGGGEGERQASVGLVPILHRGEDFDLSHLPAGLGDVEQEGRAALPPGLFGYLGEEEEKVEEERVSGVRMPTIAAIDVVPHPAVPFGGVQQGGEACLPAGAIGDNRGGGREGGRQAAVGLMATLHHGEHFDSSHPPAGLGDVEQEGGAVLPTGLFGYLDEHEEKVEERRVAEVQMPTIAAIDVVPHPAVPFGGVHQGGEACRPTDVIGGDRGGGGMGRQAAVGLMPTSHHGEDFDLSHAPAGLGDVEQEGGAGLPTGLFGYLGEDEEKVEEEERVAEIRMPNIATTDVVPHPAVPFGGVHQEGEACLPVDVTGDNRGGEGGRQAAVSFMAKLTANTTEARHDKQAKSPRRPARFGDREQEVGGAVLPTGLFGYLGEEEEEKREVVESAHTSNLTTGHAEQEQGPLLPAGLLGFLGGVEEEEAAPRVGQSCETSRRHLKGRQHEPIMRRERLQAGNDRMRHRESAAGWWMGEEKGSYVAAGGFGRIESKGRDERFFGEVCSGRAIGATPDQGMRAEATGLEGRAMRAEARVDMFDHRLELKGEGVGVGEHLWTEEDKTCEDVAVGMRQEQLVWQNMDGMAWHTLEAKAGKVPPLPSPMKRVQTMKSIVDDSPSAGKGPSAARARDGSMASMALEAKVEVKGTELETVQGLQAFPRGVRAEGKALPCVPEGRSATVAAGGLPSTAGPGDGPLIRAPSVRQTDGADEQTLQAPSTSLSRQVGQGWRQRGSIRRLFLANLAEVCASDQVQSFAVNALKTADMPMVLAQPLGYGSFGRVDDVSYASLTGQSFAMKTVTQAAGMSARFCALVEMTVFARLARTPHHNVLGALSMDDDSDLMPIVLPKARCDLGSYINSDTPGLGDKLRLVVDLARGVQHMHSMGLVHRDIKPGNVLVFESEEHGLHAKLADYGFTAEIGERCPGGMGTSGAMAFETMSADPVLGAPAQDVVSVAVVLLMVCLKRERRCSNLFTQQELRTADETAKLEVLLERARLGQDVSHETKLLEFEVSRRTMADGSFTEWLSPDKLDLMLESSDKLVGVFPSLLAVDPESREDMDFLVQFTSHLAEVNKSPERPVEEPGRGG